MIVAGLDLSLRGTGICVLGTKLLRTFRVGVTIDTKNKALDVEREKIERIITIAAEIVKRCQEFEVKAVGIENYAFGAFGGAGYSSSGTVLGELAGVVKRDLAVVYKIIPAMYSPSSARKALFGKGNGKLKKEQVQAKLKELGLVFPSHDEGDAFVIAATRYCEMHEMDSDSFWAERVWQ